MGTCPVPSSIRNTESLEKNYFRCHLQSTILIGQVNILSWGQLEGRRVPRPFLSREGSGSEAMGTSGKLWEPRQSLRTTGNTSQPLGYSI